MLGTNDRKGGGDSVVGYKSGSLVPNVFASRMSTIAPQDVPWSKKARKVTPVEAKCRDSNTENGLAEYKRP